MFIETLTEERLDSKNRRRLRKIMCLRCDQCQSEFQKPFKLSITKSKLHFCCQKCQNIANKNGNILQQHVKQTCMNRYGFENPAQVPEIQEQITKTCFERYGAASTVESISIQEKSRHTMQDRYGVDFYTQHKDMPKKSQETMIKRYGVAHASQSQLFLDKASQTSFEKYGVKHPMQNVEILERSHQRKCSKFKRSHENFSEKKFFCRSSYEQTFVKWCNSRQDLIQNLEANITTSYTFNNKNHYYFIDFEVTLFNDVKMLIEIKPAKLVYQTLNQIKIEAGKRFASTRNQTFVVVTETQLSNLEKFFQEQIENLT